MAERNLRRQKLQDLLKSLAFQQSFFMSRQAPEKQLLKK
jgi:hypothetical protein